MEWSKASKVLRSVCHPGHDAAALSRRETLAGIGLAGLFALAGRQLLAPASAAAKPLDTPVDAATVSSDDKRSEAADHAAAERNAAEPSDITEFSAHRRRHHHWHRHHWRRRYWRRRHWRRHWHRRRYWRRRVWW